MVHPSSYRSSSVKPLEWSGNLFLIAPFPDLCPLVPFNKMYRYTNVYSFDL